MLALSAPRMAVLWTLVGSHLIDVAMFGDVSGALREVQVLPALRVGERPGHFTLGDLD
jgi:hypothetical protein